MSTDDTVIPSLASASQSWNWQDLSQNTSKWSSDNNTFACTSRLKSAETHGNTINPKPLLLKRPPTSNIQYHTKRKTISTTMDRHNPVRSNNEEVEAFSKVRISDRTISMEALHQEMEGRQFIRLQQMDRISKDTFSNKDVDWVTIGVLTRKTLSKPAANGSTFMVWGLSDLDGTELGLFLFGDAYASHWKEVTGSIVAVLNATLMPATEKTKFSFKVTEAAEIVKLGKAIDFGICKGITAGEVRCRLAVNTAKTQYCLHHIAANFMQAGRGRQQLNNSTGSLRKALFAGLAKPKQLSTGVYTSAPSSSSNVKWNPLSTKKRKRNNADGGVLGVPTILTASGVVVQRGQTRLAHLTSSSSTPNQRQRGTMSLMDQLREPSTSMTSAHKRPGAGSGNLSQPSRRAQRIVSAVLAKNGKLPKTV